MWLEGVKKGKRVGRRGWEVMGTDRMRPGGLQGGLRLLSPREVGALEGSESEGACAGSGARRRPRAAAKVTGFRGRRRELGYQG